MEFDWVLDQRIRYAAFDWLAHEVAGGGLVSEGALKDGFEFDGRQVPLMGPQGIFTPSKMMLPLSIRSAARSSYSNTFGSDNLLRYRYRGKDPHHTDNVGLRGLMVSRLPLVYLHGIMPGRYAVMWPVFVVGDSMEELVFSVIV